MEANSTPETRVGHCKADNTDVYIGRGDGYANVRTADICDRGWLGNPFVPEENARSSHYNTDSITVVATREESVERFRALFEDRLEQDEAFRTAVQDIADTALGCWCQRLTANGPACHGEVIAEHADRLATQDSP